MAKYDLGRDEDMLKLNNARQYQVDRVNVIDPNAEDVDALELSYIGKYIVRCDICGQLLYSDDRDLTKIEECPYCGFSECFALVGQVVEVPIETDNVQKTPDDNELRDQVYGKVSEEDK